MNPTIRVITIGTHFSASSCVIFGFFMSRRKNNVAMGDLSSMTSKAQKNAPALQLLQCGLTHQIKKRNQVRYAKPTECHNKKHS